MNDHCRCCPGTESTSLIHPFGSVRCLADLAMNCLRRYLPDPEPYFINNQILFYSGYGYLNSPHTWKNVLYGVYRFFAIMSLAVPFSVQMLDVYLLMSDLGKLAEDLCGIIPTTLIVMKILILSYRTHKLEDLQEDFLVFRRTRTHPEEEEIWKEASRIIYLMTKAFYIMGMNCIFFWTTFPALDAKSGRVLPYPWRFPVDMYQTPYYECIYVFQVGSLFGFLFNIVSTDITYCAFIVLIIGQYKIICRDIKHIGDCVDDTGKPKPEVVKLVLARAVKTHNNILRQLDKLTMIYRDVFFMQMSLAALFMSVIVVDTTLGSRGLTLKVFQRVLYMSCTCFDVWVLCYWGSQLQNQSNELAFEIYNSPWVDMDVQARKMMLLIMTKAQNVPKLKNGLLSFELPLFLELMKFAYNAAAILQNMA